MFDGLKKILGRARNTDPAKPQTALPAANLFPVVVPSEFMRPDWPGPIEQIDASPFAVSWAFIENCGWTYVTHAQQEQWDEAGVPWQAEAFGNLLRVSNPGANGEKRDAKDRALIKVMLQDDGFGPSRLLIPNLFDAELGEGYSVAMPERTCAVAWRLDLTAPERSDVEGLIAGCYEGGTEPMNPDSFPASLFWSVARQRNW